jgi:hypothetical protein
MDFLCAFIPFFWAVSRTGSNMAIEYKGLGNVDGICKTRLQEWNIGIGSGNCIQYT